MALRRWSQVCSWGMWPLALDGRECGDSRLGRAEQWRAFGGAGAAREWGSGEQCGRRPCLPPRCCWAIWPHALDVGECADSSRASVGERPASGWACFGGGNGGGGGEGAGFWCGRPLGCGWAIWPRASDGRECTDGRSAGVQQWRAFGLAGPARESGGGSGGGGGWRRQAGAVRRDGPRVARCTQQQTAIIQQGCKAWGTARARGLT